MNAAFHGADSSTETPSTADLAFFLRENTFPQPASSAERALLERMGLVFGDVIDEFFLTTTLPPGWRKALELPSRAVYLHVCHLLDASDHRRAELMYTIAVGNMRRDVSIKLLTRYRVHRVYCDGEGNRLPDFRSDRSMLAVLDGEALAHCAPIRETRSLGKHGDKDFKEVYSWIREHYPLWESPLAYWD